jgi:hypothetical protein
MNALEYDFESLAGENLYKILAPRTDNALARIARVGYRNGEHLIGLSKPYETFTYHPTCPCKDTDGLLTNVGEIAGRITQ